LHRLGALRGLSARLAHDHGNAYSSRAILSCERSCGIALDFARPGEPVDKGYVASFKGKLRDVYPDAQFLTDPADAQRTPYKAHFIADEDILDLYEPFARLWPFAHGELMT
jgi:transposase InsO family protein